MPGRVVDDLLQVSHAGDDLGCKGHVVSPISRINSTPRLCAGDRSLR
jgi:hypothetical protein